MYLGSRPRKRRSSVWRVLTLLILIGIALYVLVQVNQAPVESAVVPTPTPTRHPSSYFTEAEELYQQGDLRGAIAAYEQALELNPGRVEARISLARLLALDGRTSEAVQVAQRAVERAPENADGWAVLGMAYDWHGQVDRALEACRHAIDLTPDHADAHAYLAEAHVDSGNWAEATEIASKALDLDGNSVDVQRNYGYVMEVQGNYTAAIEAYKRALEIHPNLAYLHIALGNNYLALGDVGAGMKSFQRATEVDPKSVRAYYRLGRAHYERGELDQAQEVLEQAVDVDPQFGLAFGYLGFTYWSRRNYEEAIPNLERAIRLESATARRRARRFFITLEPDAGRVTTPSSSVVMSGDFAPRSLGDGNTLRADLEPLPPDAGWQEARGSVSLDARTGVYTVTLEKPPEARHDEVYVGWFEGVQALTGHPLSTGRLSLSNGDFEAAFEADQVRGPRIDYFYTLGLAHFYLDECEKATPFFEAALEIDPEAENALQGMRLCQQVEG